MLGKATNKQNRRTFGVIALCRYFEIIEWIFKSERSTKREGIYYCHIFLLGKIATPHAALASNYIPPKLYFVVAILVENNLSAHPS